MKKKILLVLSLVSTPLFARDRLAEEERAYQEKQERIRERNPMWYEPTLAEIDAENPDPVEEELDPFFQYDRID
jgi:hypothetical protein